MKKILEISSKGRYRVPLIGYKVSFCFNKNKKPGVDDVWFGEKVLIEGIV